MLGAESKPSWIWSPEPAAGDDVVYFRKQFRAPAYLWNSRLTVSADDEAEIFLNGLLVAKCEQWDRPVRMEATVRLNQGDNVLAIRAHNRSGPAGVMVHLNLGGEAAVVSDGSWVAAKVEEPRWAALAFNAAGWQPARVLGPHGMDPWGNVLQRSAATSPQALTVADGFQVDLLRSAQPGEGSWINLAFDERGRLFVSPEGERPLLRFTLSEDGVDRVEPAADGLRFAMGLRWVKGELYANAIGPNGSGLYRARDRNDDGHFQNDELTLLFSTTGGSEHGYHAVRLGPDGKIYVLNGNGTSLPQAISPHSPHRNYAQDVLALGDEQNKLNRPAGYILRGDPDGKEWELYLGGLRNAYDFDFNTDGELFTFDSDMEWDWGTPWYRPTRILHCVSGAEFGWREDRGMWPDFYEDSLPPVVNVGLGSPTGVEFGTRSNFPDHYKRAFFVLDWSYGRILAIHLQPQGASYRGTIENFLRGTPLNLTDLTFGPDGAMYFLTGGRGTQSGLYRVRFIGPGTPSAKPPPPLTNDPSVDARLLRQRLDRFHGRAHPDAVEVLWPHLGSSDRFIRYAARIGLESQTGWHERALAETNATAALTALLALARTGDAQVQPALLKALAKFPLDSLDETHRLLKYRLIELSFLRQGRPASNLIELARAKLDRQYPANRFSENRELARLLTWLEAPNVVPKTISLLESASTQEEQVHCIEQLQRVRTGWTPDLRRRYFSWWTQARERLGHLPGLEQWFKDVDRTYVEGASMDKYLGDFRREAVSGLSEAERHDLAALIQTPIRPAQMLPASTRAFVRAWTMEDLVPHLDKASVGRNFERARQAFVDAQCLSCHRFGNDGGAFGPELTAAGSKYDRRSLLESLLAPSKVINEQYRATVVTLKDGSELSGRLVRENDDEVVLETNPFGGGREEIKRAEIREIRPAPFSPMPEGLVNGLTQDEILDLLAYLESNGRSDAACFKNGSP